jgi:hypothetical protein
MVDRQIGSKSKARESATEDAPRECEFGECSENVTHRVRFKCPEDNVFLCLDHKKYVRNLPGNKWAKKV